MPYVGMSMDRKRNRRIAADLSAVAKLTVGTVVDVQRDNGAITRTTVKYAPGEIGQAGSGLWVVGVAGIAGWYGVRLVTVVSEAGAV
jgi:hypothetical protein